MAKDLKIKFKNTQLAKAAGLDKLKAKLAGEKKGVSKKKKKAEPEEKKPEEVKKRVRAKTKSAFAPPESVEEKVEEITPKSSPPEPQPEEVKEEQPPEDVVVEPVEKLEAPESFPEPSTQEKQEPKPTPPLKTSPAKEKLGPTGRHINDLLPPKEEKSKEKKSSKPSKDAKQPAGETTPKAPAAKDDRKRKNVRDFKDLKPYRQQMRPFDSRDKMGLTAHDDGGRWRKKRPSKGSRPKVEEIVTRPTAITIRFPISVKDLASEMKLKSTELISKLFMQGIVVTLNDLLDDETVVQLLGHEFSCDITIDTSEEERIRITDLSVNEEISQADSQELTPRPPVVAFMGHVDHGKTSLIDKIRESNIVSGEAGAITQHMGAFKCKTKVGEITILDTPGHEAFSAMRARGAEVTDIVVLVVAGDEGIKEQTQEAIQHAKAAGVTILCAINKCDKPNFNAEEVYRQLSENDLLPEAWGGQTLTINTSAATGEGIAELLEMLALQSEVLELKANPNARARGSVLESELHKGMGSVATILVQNGTLKRGDAVVFSRHWGRIKTMHDEHRKLLQEAGPSTPIEVTGLSGIPSAGDPFIVVKDEKEAREIAETRAAGQRQLSLVKKKTPTLESLLEKKGAATQKTLKLIIRADVQGSCEALKNSLLKIESDKASVDIIFTGVGEISESDVQLAAASDAVILGFHTQVESHADSLIKELGVVIRLHDVIYHAIAEIKEQMLGLLDKIEEETERGEAEIKAIFKSSGLGSIAGCLVTDGVISRNHRVRVAREGEIIWKGKIASIKRVKEDVKEVKKGFECGVVLEGFNAVQEGDTLQTYEITYRAQEL